jgi:outer membrane protein assembly factor BamB
MRNATTSNKFSSLTKRACLGINASLVASGLLLAGAVNAQEFRAGEPIGSVNEAGERKLMSDNVKVYGAFHFSESCTFDSTRNLILAMNNGNPGDGTENDGFVSLINPDGSVHTPKWIGVTRDGLDLESGRPLRNIPVPGATLLNGIAVSADGTIYASNTRPPERLYKISAEGEVSVLIDGAPLAIPNGVAIDGNGDVVVVNIGDNAVLTFSPNGELLGTEYAVEGGNDGVVILEDGTKYVSSVRFGSVSRILPGQEATLIAEGIPSAASMCYDSIQHQLVIPLNSNYALAFIKL